MANYKYFAKHQTSQEKIKKKQLKIKEKETTYKTRKGKKKLKIKKYRQLVIAGKTYTKRIIQNELCIWGAKYDDPEEIIYMIREQQLLNKIGKNQYKIIMYLNNFFKRGYFVFQKYETISVKTGIKKQQVKETIENLKQNGLIITNMIYRSNRKLTIILPDCKENPLKETLLESYVFNFLKPKNKQQKVINTRNVNHTKKL